MGGAGDAVTQNYWLANMIEIQPITLEGHGIRLEPLAYEHQDGLAVAATDGKLWELWFTAVPEPEQTRAYIADALAGQRDGHMLPWAVREVDERRRSSAARAITISSPRSIASRSVTPGTENAGSAATSTPAASCCCSLTRSIRLGAKWSACAPTISTSPRSERLRPWAPRRMASSAITWLAATEQCATA